MVPFFADKADFMREFVTEQDLEHARGDAAFRQQLMANSLERLLEALKHARLRTPPRRRPASCAKASILRSSSPTGLQGAAKNGGP